MDSFVPVFNQALGEIRIIRAKYYDDTIEFTKPQIFGDIACVLDSLWRSASEGLLSTRYPGLSVCSYSIREVSDLFNDLNLLTSNRILNLHQPINPSILDSLLVAHISFDNISRFIEIDGKYDFPPFETALAKRISTDSQAASALLLETYQVLRDINSQEANALK